MKSFLLILGLYALGPATAEEGHVFKASNPTWQAECSSCHVAYPPRLLPASSWRALMAHLDKHFGSDASVDPKANAEILRFLERNAGRERNAQTQPILRITETPWFRREHDEVSPRLWKSPIIKNGANCEACHTGAAKGDYSERGIRLPRER